MGEVREEREVGASSQPSPGILAAVAGRAAWASER